MSWYKIEIKTWCDPEDYDNEKEVLKELEETANHIKQSYFKWDINTSIEVTKEEDDES